MTNKWIFLPTVFGVYLTAWFLQTQFFINCDVSWDMHVAKIYLAGGKYIKDFFQINPPLNILIYSIPVLMTKFFPVGIIIAFRLFIFLLAAMSIGVSYLLVSKIYDRQPRILTSSFLIVLTFIYLILPIFELGERENLMLMLTMPYFLTVCYRLQNHRLNRFYGVSIGFFAAIGFAIKPYFLISFVFIELYYLVKIKNIFAWLRAESLTIILFMLIYLAAIILYYPEYITTVVPLTSMFYYSGFSDPWPVVFFNGAIYFCLLTIVLYLIQDNNSPNKIFTTVFFIATIGFLISYSIQKMAWRYHYYPAYSMSCLLFTILISDLILNTRKRLIYYLFIILLLIITLQFPINNLRGGFRQGFALTNDLKMLQNFLQTQANHKSVYFISANGDQSYPLFDYSNVINPSRFQHLLWLPGATKQAYAGQLTAAKRQGENYFIDLFIEDLTKTKPDLIFVDVKDLQHFPWFINFDYLAYFQHIQAFRNFWRDYSYLTSIQSTHFELSNVDSWNIYLLPENTEVNPKNVSGATIVLQKQGSHAVAYFIINHKIYSDERKTQLIRNIDLTPQDMTFMQSQPALQIIKRNSKNSAIINHLINNAIAIYDYKYDVYKRRSLPD